MTPRAGAANVYYRFGVQEPSPPGPPGEPLADFFASVADAVESTISSIGSFVDQWLSGEGGGRELPRLDAATFAAQSGRLNIRPPSPSDRRELHRIYDDPGNQAAHGWTAKTVAELHRDLWAPSAFDGLTRTALVGVRRDTYEIIGLATLQRRRGTGAGLGLSIGLSTLPEHRGQGLAIELLAAMITAARAYVATADNGKPFPLWVGTATTNEHIQSMMASLGYQRDDESVPYAAPNGETFETFWYQVGLDTDPPRFVPRPADDPLQ